jgi:hypothetical protein
MIQSPIRNHRSGIVRCAVAAILYVAFAVYLYQPHFDTFQQWRWLVPLCALFGASGAYALSRRWVAGFAGSCLAGAVYGFGPFMLGLVKLCVGLLFGGAAVLWMKAFPRPVLGLFLLLAGWSLAEASRAWKTRAAIWVGATMVVANYAAGSLLVGFAAGWLAWWLVRRWDEPMKGSAR